MSENKGRFKGAFIMDEVLEENKLVNVEVDILEAVVNSVVVVCELLYLTKKTLHQKDKRHWLSNSNLYLQYFSYNLANGKLLSTWSLYK